MKRTADEGRKRRKFGFGGRYLYKEATLDHWLGQTPLGGLRRVEVNGGERWSGS
jgi:hypothetical protein